jgi:hypothetical protein
MLYITLLLRIITYLTYIQYVWEIDDFVIIFKKLINNSGAKHKEKS